MTTADERLQILNMIESGQISAAEGAELLRALAASAETAPNEPLKGASAARWFRVRITDTKTGRAKVNVNIPLALVNVGIKMGARFAPESEEVDLESIMAAVRRGHQGKVVDVVDEDEDERVEIFVE